MALIKCPDCGKDISDLAPACIGCGSPTPGQMAGEENACLDCGRYVSAKAEACIHCGRPIEASGEESQASGASAVVKGAPKAVGRCPQCSEVMPEGMAACPKCHPASPDPEQPAEVENPGSSGKDLIENAESLDVETVDERRRPGIAATGDSVVRKGAATVFGRRWSKFILGLGALHVGAYSLVRVVFRQSSDVNWFERAAALAIAYSLAAAAAFLLGTFYGLSRRTLNTSAGKGRAGLRKERAWRARR